jgi:hypothetical protein
VIEQDFGAEVPVIPSQSGVSPIGTSSPNSGTAANTNSTYADGAFTSGIAEQTGTTYTVQNTDYQGIVIFNTSSPITVTLNQAVKTNFSCTILNLGTGAITLSPNGGLTVNGNATLALASGIGCQVFFANRSWLAYSGTTSYPVLPSNTAAVAGEYLTGYNSVTGAFSVSTPAGISVTITTAQLTTGGSQGSMTFTGGILTSQVQAT